MPLRQVERDELLVPGQSLLVVLDADPFTNSRIATALANLAALNQEEMRSNEAAPNRLFVFYRVVLGLPSANVVQTIMREARLAATVAGAPTTGGGFALWTVDVGEAADRAFTEAGGRLLDVAFLPWTAAAALVPRATDFPIGPVVGVGIGLVILGVYLARR